MTDVYIYTDPTGVITADAGVIKTQVQDEYKALFGDDLIIDDATPTAQMLLTTAETLARIAVADNNAQVANQINPDMAGGIWLIAILALFGSYITAGYPTVVDGVVVMGSPGANVAAGAFQVSETVNDAIFYNVEPLTIPEGGTLSNVQFKAINNGPISCNANTLTQIVSNIDGFETVNNPTAGVLGALDLSDAKVKNLLNNTRAANSMGSSQAITAGLSLTNGVTSLKLLENTKSTTQTIKGVVMVSHSMYVCVAGSASNESIGQELTDVKNIGCSYNNGNGINQSVEIIDPYSTQAIEVLFDTPSILDMNIRVTVSTYSTVLNLQDQVKDAVVAYADGEVPNQPGFVVGAAVSPSQIAGGIMYFVPGVFVKLVEVGKQSFTQQGTLENGSPIITGMTYTDDISNGYIVTGDGIPDNTIVIDKTSNTMTLSNDTTLTGTEVLTITKSIVYQNTEIPIAVWQKAFTTVDLVTVIQE